jgi:hypothetical protein
LVLGSTARPGASEQPDLSGHWTADVPLPDGRTPQLVVDLDRLGLRWVGEFDVLALGVENYPVLVELVNGAVKLTFADAEAHFTGRQSADGNRLAGVLEFGTQKIEIELRKAGEIAFSPLFLELEAVADDSTRVENLSARGDELRLRFNADRDKIRLVLLLAPS